MCIDRGPGRDPGTEQSTPPCPPCPEHSHSRPRQAAGTGAQGSGHVWVTHGNLSWGLVSSSSWGAASASPDRSPSACRRLSIPSLVPVLRCCCVGEAPTWEQQGRELGQATSSPLVCARGWRPPVAGSAAACVATRVWALSRRLPPPWPGVPLPHQLPAALAPSASGCCPPAPRAGPVLPHGDRWSSWRKHLSRGQWVAGASRRHCAVSDGSPVPGPLAGLSLAGPQQPWSAVTAWAPAPSCAPPPGWSSQP